VRGTHFLHLIDLKQKINKRDFYQKNP